MMVPFGFGAGFRIAMFDRAVMLELGRPILGGRGSKMGGILLVTGGRGDGGGLLLDFTILCIK